MTSPNHTTRQQCRGRTRTVALVALACLLVLAACSPRPSRKVAIIGWDGASWAVIDPLLHEGRLPNLKRLLERGSRGVLVATPPFFSPTLWTTLATGFGPREHGVTGFELPGPRGERNVLASTFHRRRAPVWRIASEAGLHVGFVGWWTTWPAERVDGYIVSDHLAYNRWGEWSRLAQGGGQHLTYPPDLVEELEPHAVRPESLAVETLTALAPFNDVERKEMMDAERPIIFHGPSVFRFGYSTDASNVGFASHLLDSREQPDLLGMVFILGDVAGHVFWHHYEPSDFGLSAGSPSHLREAIPNVYRQLDAWTGEILERLDPETLVIVVSDHGMRAGERLPVPRRNPAGDHDPEGILVVSGPGVPAGASFGKASMLDFAPTLLTLLGLPVAEEMPGQVIEAVLPADLGERPAPVASYGEGRPEFAPETSSPGEQDYLERLRALGYIQ